MTADLLDMAFLARVAGRLPVEPVAPLREPDARPAAPEPVSPAHDPVVSRLLEAFPEAWARLADRVEAAFSSGSRVVCVAGRSRGEGRSTVVCGLAHALRARGCFVACHEDMASGVAAADAGPVIVDAGIWFPHGPLHLGRLAHAALGCDAAVLVRRAASATCPGHATALEAVGVHVLGEVLTFADPPIPDGGSR